MAPETSVVYVHSDDDSIDDIDCYVFEIVRWWFKQQCMWQPEHSLVGDVVLLLLQQYPFTVSVLVHAWRHGNFDSFTIQRDVNDVMCEDDVQSIVCYGAKVGDCCPCARKGAHLLCNKKE